MPEMTPERLAEIRARVDIYRTFGNGAATICETEVLYQLLAEVERLRAELAELKASADLRHAADMRAIKMWQEATGKKLTWPDHADLCVWLMEQLSEARRKALEEATEVCNRRARRIRITLAAYPRCEEELSPFERLLNDLSAEILALTDQPASNGWISVDEGLPEPHRIVLAITWMEFADSYAPNYHLAVCEDGKWEDVCRRQHREVTHWRELPKWPEAPKVKP